MFLHGVDGDRRVGTRETVLRRRTLTLKIEEGPPVKELRTAFPEAEKGKKTDSHLAPPRRNTALFDFSL